MITDFGILTAVESESTIEFYFPYNPSIVSLMKSYKARWNPQRKCWHITKQDSENKEWAANILKGIGSALLKDSPDAWKNKFVDLCSLCCVTRKYELAIGEGGMRIALPGGHPLEYRFKENDKIQRNQGKFFIKAQDAISQEIFDAVKRIIKEDRDIYNDWMEPAIGRGLEGNLDIQAFRPDLVNKNDYIAFVSRSFLKNVDSAFGNAPINTHAMRVKKLTKSEDGKNILIALSYLELKEGYDLLASFTKNNSKPPVLTEKNTSGKWRIRSRM